MIIDIIKLKSGLVEEIDIDETITIEKNKLEQTELMDLDPITVKGNITKDSLENYRLNLLMTGKMILPCSITLKPVDYPFEVEIDDYIEKLLSEIPENNKKIENSIDILPIIWENVLMEIPLKVTSEEAASIKLSGDGWRLVTEESTKQTDSAFDKLKDLL